MSSLRKKKIAVFCMAVFIVSSWTFMALHPSEAPHEDDLLIEVVTTEVRDYGSNNGKTHFHDIVIVEVIHLASKESKRVEFARDNDYNIYFPHIQHHLPDFIKARRVTDQGLYLRLQMSIDQDFVASSGDKQTLRTQDRRLRTAFGF